MALPIPPGIFDRTVDFIAMILAELGASVGELLEVGDLDGMELEIRETTGLDCLWKTTARGVPTVRMIVTTKPDNMTDGFFKNNLCDWFNYSCPSC